MAVREEDGFDELVKYFERFLDAGDENRYYQLTRDEIRLILAEIERLREVETDSGLSDRE